MSLYQFATWLDETPVSLSLKDNFLVIPLAQSVHILAIAFVFSGSVLLCLRSYGVVGTERAVRDWGHKLTGRLWIALSFLLASGSLLVLAEPTRELVNPAFQIKLLIIIPTIAFAIWLARHQGRQAEVVADPVARAGSLLLLLLWLAIIGVGRWIAYI